MKKTWFGVVLVFALLGAALGVPAHRAAAQGSTLPPTIISFGCDLTSITVADAEAGQTTATLSWVTVGLTDPYRLVVYAYQVDQWQWLLPADTTPLSASGEVEITVTHPGNFGLPTYALMILNGQTVVGQQIVTIPYDTGEPTQPEIVSLSSTVQDVAAYAVANGTAQVPVSWEVTDRAPYSNLVFEQVLEGGRTVSVELPRTNLWVPSQGSGVVAPIMPAVGQPIRLRLRIVNMLDDSTLAEQDLAPITVSGSLVPPSPTPVSVPPTAVPGTSAARVIYFTAAPEVVARGGTLTLSWQVTGASQVAVYRTEPGGPLAEQSPVSSPTGSWTLTLPTSYTTVASFLLFATDAAGNTTQSAVTVSIICPYIYFFGDPGPGLSSCPLNEATTVQAAFQAFQGGVMIWRADTSEILVLYNSGMVSRFRDTWQEGETVAIDETPPAGLYAPVRGFGKVWASDQGVRNGLGWATTLEQGYTMQYQTSGDYKYARLYLTWPDGRIAYIVESSWAFK